MHDKSVNVERQKTVYTHVYLHSAAELALEQAQKTEDGRFYNCLCSIVMTAFCIEAYLNYVGDKSFKEWNEKAAPLDKLEIVAKRIGIKVDYGKKPFQGIKLANQFRNDMAHGKTATLSNSGLQMLGAKSKPKKLDTQWESVCTIECAKSYLIDLNEVIKIVEKGYDFKDFPFGILQFETRLTKPAP